MSLTLEKLHALRSKGFDKLYDRHAPEWKEMAEDAVQYAKTYIAGKEKIRSGDIVEILQNAIKVNAEFEKYVKEKGLQQKYWVSWFSEYIVDQIFPQAEIK